MINNQVLQNILDQIDAALECWKRLIPHKVAGASIPYVYRIDDDLEQETITILSSTIDRLAPENSIYKRDAKAVFDYFRPKRGDNPEVIDRLAGILKALKADYQAGYLKTVEELIHADVFADFLEMAAYFDQQGYKDPAAVMAGSVLEEHLRKLCIKHGIDTEEKKSTGNVPKTAGRLNDDLAGQSVYSKLDQKSATAWIDLRNKAAHGKYTEYTKEQVALMVQGIRDFLVRYPA